VKKKKISGLMILVIVAVGIFVLAGLSFLLRIGGGEDPRTEDNFHYEEVCVTKENPAYHLEKREKVVNGVTQTWIRLENQEPAPLHLTYKLCIDGECGSKRYQRWVAPMGMSVNGMENINASPDDVEIKDIIAPPMELCKQEKVYD